jgi:PiT family inorganic phosphate transporter
MSGSLLLVVFIILVALAFDYINGFHDAANSIATVVSTRVLTPMQAVACAAFFNFVAAFGFGVQVPRPVGKGVADAGLVEWVILGGLAGAITWNLITWYYGIPSSSSHALIGGYAGAAVAKAGFGALVPSGLLKILVFIVLAPVLGLCLGFTLMVITLWTVRSIRPSRVDGLFRRLQLLSAAAYSLGHGTNDAQKTMGIIAILLFSAGYLGSEFYFPMWVILAAHAAIGLGTRPGLAHRQDHGDEADQAAPDRWFRAETAGAIMPSHRGGIPVSTTHTITGSIIRSAPPSGSRGPLGVASNIVWA